MQPSISYLVYATARSGSTLLCEALTGTGIAGWPDEYFVPGAQSTLRPATWLTKLGTVPLPDYVREIVQENTTEDGVFGAKFDWFTHQTFISEMRTYPECRNLSDHEILSSFFPNLHYIWVTRRDKIRQAISVWKAMQDNKWNSQIESSPSGAGVPLRRVEAAPRFSFPLIAEQLLLIADSEAGVASYFAENRIVPCTVVYEDLALDYEGTASRVLNYLGIEASETVSLAHRRLQKQSGALNDAWFAEYARKRLWQHRLHLALGLPGTLRNPNVLHWHVLPPLRRVLALMPGPLRRLADRI